MSVQTVDLDQGRSKHWARYVLIALAILTVSVVVFEYFHWLNSGMAFWDHMGHLRDHIWSLVTTGQWHPTPAKWVW